MPNAAAVEDAYQRAPAAIKSSARLARRWAVDRLMRREGAGHHLALSRYRRGDRRIVCSFAKPSWPSDHSGTPHATGAEAIVRAVLEYEAGW